MSKQQSQQHLSLPHLESFQSPPFPTAWQGAEAAGSPGLFPRVATYYTKLQSLPRRVR